MTLKDDKIIVANADTKVLAQLSTVVRKHLNVIKEGWIREVTLMNEKLITFERNNMMYEHDHGI